MRYILGSAATTTPLLDPGEDRANSPWRESAICDPRRQAWSRPSLGGSRRWPAATSALRGQPAPNDAGQRLLHAGSVVIPGLDPVGIPEVEFGKVAMEMGLANMLTNTVTPALEDAEKPLNRVRVVVPAHVFLGAVGNHAVVMKMSADPGVDG